MRTAVVTGGAGFIGSHLVDLLLSLDYSVTVIDSLCNSTLSNLSAHKTNPRLRFVQQDISHPGSWLTILGDSDEIYHLAGLAAIVPSIECPRQYFLANVLGTLNVLEASNRSSSFVYAASSSCYGLPRQFPTHEDVALSPQYPYALTKLQGEQLVQHWSRIYKFNTRSLRLFNVYGLRSRTDSSYGAMFGVFMAQLLSGKPLTIVGDGSQKRDFVYVTDVVRAFHLAATLPSSYSTFNVGSGSPVSVKYIADLLSNHQTSIPKRPGEPDITHADISLISSELGWKPTVSIETGVKIMKDNLEYWRNCPVWDPDAIEEATRLWFKYLS